MKKNVLALSIAAAVAGFGAIGSAHAITTTTVGASPFGAVTGGLVPGSTAVVPGVTANYLKANPSGIGHILIVPYFTTQGTNVTLLSIVNTDSRNGKAVKVRVRGAGNSDDLFDFQVFLSPNDVWTAMVNKDANGLSQITVPATENSCMKGLVKNVPTPFSKLRLDKVTPTDVLVAPTLNNQTREGYVEIFNMADIEPFLWATNTNNASWSISSTANPIYTSTLHVAGVAPCTGLGFLDTDAPGWAGLTNPSTGLTGEWLIVNQDTAAAYGGNATAIQALQVVNNTPPASDTGVPALGNIVYWPQTKVPFNVSVTPSSWVTADPLLSGDPLMVGWQPGVTPIVHRTVPLIAPVMPLLQDFPDLSTPYTKSALAYYTTPGTDYARAPAYQAWDLTESIAVTSVTNEFLTAPSIKAATDFVFSMPTRRYSVAMNYETLLPLYNTLIPEYFSIVNTVGVGRQVCTFNILQFAYDQNEQTPSLVVPSPQTIPMFCGETTVFGINQSLPTKADSTKVLSANIAAQGADVGSSNYDAGWLRVVTPGLQNYGLPILGSAFTQAIGSNPLTNFGVNAEHKSTRYIGFRF